MKKIIFNIKRWVQKLLIYLLKKLKMPLPFNQFTRNNMLEIYLFIKNALPYKSIGLELYNIPDLYTVDVKMVYDKTNDYGTLQYTNTQTGATASININSEYAITVLSLDNQTADLITNFVKQYLHQAKFLP